MLGDDFTINGAYENYNETFNLIYSGGKLLGVKCTLPYFGSKF